MDRTGSVGLDLNGRPKIWRMYVGETREDLNFDPPSLHIAVYQSNNSRNVPIYQACSAFQCTYV